MKKIFILLCLISSGCASFAPPRMAKMPLDPTEHIPILLYHHIQALPKNANASLRRWSVTPRKLKEHLGWIAREGFSVITMEQLNGHFKNKTPLPARPIILTFDDGWKDHYTVVFFILQKYHFSATFFIITESVGHSAFVSWDQLKEMSAAGMDIQAHSLTHPYLTKLSEKEAYREISGSKKELESHLAKPVNIFAYPFGSHSEKIIAMVKDAGYESATIIHGSNLGYLFRADRRYTLSRIAIEEGTTVDDLAEIIQKMKENYVAY